MSKKALTRSNSPSFDDLPQQHLSDELDMEQSYVEMASVPIDRLSTSTILSRPSNLCVPAASLSPLERFYHSYIAQFDLREPDSGRRVKAARYMKRKVSSSLSSAGSLDSGTTASKAALSEPVSGTTASEPLSVYTQTDQSELVSTSGVKTKLDRKCCSHKLSWRVSQCHKHPALANTEKLGKLFYNEQTKQIEMSRKPECHAFEHLLPSKIISKGSHMNVSLARDRFKIKDEHEQFSINGRHAQVIIVGDLEQEVCGAEATCADSDAQENKKLSTDVPRAPMNISGEHIYINIGGENTQIKTYKDYGTVNVLGKEVKVGHETPTDKQTINDAAHPTTPDDAAHPKTPGDAEAMKTQPVPDSEGPGASTQGQPGDGCTVAVNVKVIDELEVSKVESGAGLQLTDIQMDKNVDSTEVDVAVYNKEVDVGVGDVEVDVAVDEVHRTENGLHVDNAVDVSQLDAPVLCQDPMRPTHVYMILKDELDLMSLPSSSYLIVMDEMGLMEYGQQISDSPPAVLRNLPAGQCQATAVNATNTTNKSECQCQDTPAALESDQASAEFDVTSGVKHLTNHVTDSEGSSCVLKEFSCEEEEETYVCDDSGLVDIYKLNKKVTSQNHQLRKCIKKYRDKTTRLTRLQLYMDQLRLETEQLKAMLAGIDRQGEALRCQAAEMRCTVTAVCDLAVATISKESDARRLEPACYRRYTNIRSPPDATAALAAVRSRLKALGELEVLIYRKQLVLHHVLPTLTQEKPPASKRANRLAHKAAKNKQGGATTACPTAVGNIVIEVVSPLVEINPQSWSDDASHTDSPVTVPTEPQDPPDNLQLQGTLV